MEVRFCQNGRELDLKMSFFLNWKMEDIGTDNICKNGLWSCGRRSLKKGVVKAEHTCIPLIHECPWAGMQMVLTLKHCLVSNWNILKDNDTSKMI